MEPITLEDVRKELRNEVSTSVDTAVAKSLDSAIAKIDWPAILKGTIAKMDQDPPAPAERGLAKLNEWATARGDKPLDDDELIHITPDGVEVFSANDVREHAVMRQAGVVGAALTLDDIGGLGIPFGSVLLGGIPGILTGEVIDGFISPTNATGDVSWGNVFSKGLVAAGGAFLLPRWLGDRPAMFFAGVLVVQMISDVLPLDRLSAWLVGKFTKEEATASASYAAAAAATQRRAAAQAGDLPLTSPTGANSLLAAVAA